MALAGLLAFSIFISSSHSAFGRTVTVEITLLSLNNKYEITVAGQLPIYPANDEMHEIPFSSRYKTHCIETPEPL
jgi:negative regulator of sigma E activity